MGDIRSAGTRGAGDIRSVVHVVEAENVRDLGPPGKHSTDFGGSKGWNSASLGLDKSLGRRVGKGSTNG